MSKFDLKDKVAIVTGGAGGIGASIARAFSEAEAKVVVSSRNQENIAKVAADLKASGGESLAVAADVTIPERVDNMIAQTVNAFGRVDILVNNAGGAMAMGKPEELSLDGWNLTIAVNLTGPFSAVLQPGRS